MYTSKSVALSLKDFILSSSKGEYKVKSLDGDYYNYHIQMNFNINGQKIGKNKNSPTLSISDSKLLVKKLTILLNLMAKFHANDQDYYRLSDSNFLKYLLVSCVSNMQINDFLSPLSYLDKQIEVYSNLSYLYKDVLIGEINIKGETVQIYESLGKNKASMETPIHMQFKYKSNDNIFLSPKIHHYVCGDICYINSVQNIKDQQANSLTKKLDRYFRKANKDVEENESYDNDSILNISPNFLITLTLFIASLSEDKITNYRFSDYFPLRYMNKKGALEYIKADENEVDRIQTSLTNKLALLLERFAYHFKDSDYSFDDFGYIDFKFSDTYLDKENIVTDFYNAIKLFKKTNTIKY